MICWESRRPWDSQDNRRIPLYASVRTNLTMCVTIHLSDIDYALQFMRELDPFWLRKCISITQLAGRSVELTGSQLLTMPAPRCIEFNHRRLTRNYVLEVLGAQCLYHPSWIVYLIRRKGGLSGWDRMIVWRSGFRNTLV
jgi:hypothetical protein